MKVAPSSCVELLDRPGEILDAFARVCAPDEGLDVPLRPRQARGREAEDGEAETPRRLRDAEDRLAAGLRIADDAPSDALPAELELRLHHRQQLTVRAHA